LNEQPKQEMNMTTATQMHSFEKAGLGLSPFRYVGMEHQEIEYGQRVIGSVGGCSITTKPGGTCAYCGQYIVNMFQVESADGKRFHVGCDCIEKVGDAGLIKLVAADLKKLKAQREADRIVRAKSALPKAYGLTNQPHPNGYMAEQGKTLRDYCEWLMTHSGTAGKLRAARMIEAAIASIAEE
jgi:hypothetical protein